MNLNFLLSDIGNDIQKRLVPDWKRALSFYSVQAGIIGGAVLAGIAAVEACRNSGRGRQPFSPSPGWSPAG